MIWIICFSILKQSDDNDGDDVVAINDDDDDDDADDDDAFILFDLHLKLANVTKHSSVINICKIALIVNI